MKKAVLGLSIALIFMLAGCSSDDDPVASLTITGESGNPVSLNGTWDEGCSPDTVENESEQFANTMSGSSFSGVGSIYFGVQDCSGTADLSLRMAGSFVLGAEVTVALNVGSVTAVETDVTVTTANITPNNATAVLALNTGFCGFTDWAQGVAKSILSTTCFPTPVFKDVTYIDDTVIPNLMYSGISADDGGTVDANGYPDTLDPDPDQRL